MHTNTKWQNISNNFYCNLLLLTNKTTNTTTNLWLNRIHQTRFHKKSSKKNNNSINILWLKEYYHSLKKLQHKVKKIASTMSYAYFPKLLITIFAYPSHKTVHVWGLFDKFVEMFVKLFRITRFWLYLQMIQC